MKIWGPPATAITSMTYGPEVESGTGQCSRTLKIEFSVGGLASGNTVVLAWGGLRGGISIALALALPDVDAKFGLLAATYAVAVFTILVQGGTLGFVARRYIPPERARTHKETV